MISKRELKECISKNDLQGSIICLHASFRSLGPVLGGPNALIEAFLELDCTLLVPSFYYGAEAYPIANTYQRNGIDYSLIASLQPKSYEDLPDQIDTSMGIISKTIVSDARSIRTKNPHDSFCVIGKHAELITAGASLLDVYSPYKRSLDAGLRAYIVLLGVDFASCTPIHFAEEKAGKTLFRRWALYHGEVVEVEVGSCSEGFEKLRPWVMEIERRDVWGQSVAKIYPFGDFVNRLSDVLRASPALTRCNDQRCPRCRDMASGGRSL